MGIPILVIGRSGAGKSCSLMNFDENEVGVFNVASKPLPFRKKLKVIDGANYNTIYKVLENPKLKTYVIDDSQYLMAFESFAKAKEIGYGKFTDMALNFYNLIQYVIRKTPADVIVYFLHHAETTDDGKIKAKTLGKMLDNQLTVEGLFSIVLLADVEGTDHFFITNSDGSNTAKSPMDMFEFHIPNDLKAVDRKVRDYYGFKEDSNTEIKEEKENKK